MIRAVVDFALNQRLFVLAFALLLFVGGIVAFHRLPVEAYPDVANNYAWVITQWPGRAAEEVERQVTIPLETALNGIPHTTHLRSVSLAGLSVVILIFDDDSDNAWNRQKVLERLTMVTLPGNLQPDIGPDYSPVGQIYFYTLRSTNPRYDAMDLKSLQDWVLVKQFKSVPNVVDVSSFGGPTREYQVRVDPARLVSYGLSIGQVEQQLDEQQRERRRELHRGGHAADQRARRRVDPQHSGYRGDGHHHKERHAGAGQGHCRRRAGSEDPARSVRQGDPSRGRADHRQQ